MLKDKKLLLFSPRTTSKTRFLAVIHSKGTELTSLRVGFDHCAGFRRRKVALDFKGGTADPDNMQASFTIKAPSRPPALKSEVSARRLSKTPPTPERRPSIRQSAFVRGVKRLARRYYEWKSAHQYLGRYTVDKLLALEEYQRVTSPLRVFAVIALTPLPGLLAITLIAAIPLESPLKGVSANASYFVQSALAYTVMALSLLFFIRGTLGLPQSAYSHRQCILIGILTAGCNELAMLALSIVWAFPLPFRDFLGIPTFFTLLTATHVWMLRSRLRHYYRSMLRYIPLVCAQASTLFIFQGLAILFANVPQEVQGVITITFPLLRAFLKRMIWTFAGCLDDISTDVTICVVEIFGSLFQNVCVQNARSPAIGALIIVVDFAQALVEVYMYLNHKFVVDGSRAVSTAVRIVESSLYPTVLTSTTGTDPAKPDPNEAALDISHRGNSRMLSYEEAFPQLKKTNFTLPKRRSRILAGTEMLDLGSVDPAAVAADPTSGRPPLISPASVTGSKPPRKASVDDIDIAHRENAKLLKQTLQLLFASEVLVFAEYAEFRIVESCWRLGSALYLLGVWRWRVAHFHDMNDLSEGHHVAGLGARLRDGYSHIIRSSLDHLEGPVRRRLGLVFRHWLGTTWTRPAGATCQPSAARLTLVFFGGGRIGGGRSRWQWSGHHERRRRYGAMHRPIPPGPRYHGSESDGNCGVPRGTPKRTTVMSDPWVA